MVILRRTHRLAASLPETGAQSDRSGTALGDWHVNRLVLNRQPLLLLVSAVSLLPIVLPARDVRTLPRRLPQIVGDRLSRLGVESSWITPEIATMTPVLVSRTTDRAVLGILVDFAKALPYYAESTLARTGTGSELEEWLQDTPCFVSGTRTTIFPVDKTVSALRDR
jgi:hypothetical protein